MKRRIHIGPFERAARERRVRESLWQANWTMRYGPVDAIDDAIDQHNAAMDEAERLGFRGAQPALDSARGEGGA